ncbi:unnamed protein product [Cyprideis torosa]|uniref:Golgin subfamily A conserved domain-containing protein n=1 Tax=Cyprideis torosa TaxID=163714 RepID=A0A7R8ZK87_9CRUS|nr:unnamed protein product [Cyprideis torosa]CAG0883968.1 unnamed protein product [Cyprideis torosa]
MSSMFGATHPSMFGDAHQTNASIAPVTSQSVYHVVDLQDSSEVFQSDARPNPSGIISSASTVGSLASSAVNTIASYFGGSTAADISPVILTSSMASMVVDEQKGLPHHSTTHHHLSHQHPLLPASNSQGQLLHRRSASEGQSKNSVAPHRHPHRKTTPPRPSSPATRSLGHPSPQVSQEDIAPNLAEGHPTHWSIPREAELPEDAPLQRKSSSPPPLSPAQMSVPPLSAAQMSLPSAEEYSRRPHAPSPQQATDARKDTIELLVSERNLLTQEKDQLAHQLMAATAESESLHREVTECRERILELSRESAVIEGGRKAAEDEVVRLEREARELRDEVQRTRSSLERVTEEKVEMGSRMQELSEQQAETEKKLKETESQLRIQNLQLSQLQNVGAEVSSFQGEFERVSAEKFELEKTLAQAKERVRTLSEENEKTVEQYQGYISQFTSLQSKVESLSMELLASRETNSAISAELAILKSSASGMVSVEDLGQERRQRAKTDEENKALQEKARQLVNDNEHLSTLLSESSTRIERLEEEIKRLHRMQEDKQKILASAQSDQVAASRAIQQNRTLKIQLEQLQSAFELLTEENKKMERELVTARRRINELDSTCQSLREDMHKAVQGIATHGKEEQTTVTSTSSSQVTASTVQPSANPIGVAVTEALQKELEAAQAELSALHRQNQILRSQVAMMNQADSGDEEEEETRNSEGRGKEAMVPLFVLQRTEQERDEWRRQVERMKVEEEEARKRVATLPSAAVSAEHFVQLQEAMQRLEERFKKTMDQVAELTNEKQDLEHLCMQLQGETETIGEYVALYRTQRELIRERATEKDQAIKELGKDREQLKELIKELEAAIQDDKGEAHEGGRARSNGGVTLDEHSLVNGDEPGTVSSPVVKKVHSKEEDIRVILQKLKSCNLLMKSSLEKSSSSPVSSPPSPLSRLSRQLNGPPSSECHPSAFHSCIHCHGNLLTV